MPFITQGKANLKYILIVVILAAIVGGGILGYYYLWIKDIETRLVIVELKMPEKEQSSSLVAQVTYICNGDKTIEADFYKGEQVPVKPGEPPIPSGSVKIVLSDGRSFNLPQTISADGGRYANSDESFVFWSKGDGAIVLENNVEKSYVGCVLLPK